MADLQPRQIGPVGRRYVGAQLTAWNGQLHQWCRVRRGAARCDASEQEQAPRGPPAEARRAQGGPLKEGVAHARTYTATPPAPHLSCAPPARDAPPPEDNGHGTAAARRPDGAPCARAGSGPPIPARG